MRAIGPTRRLGATLSGLVLALSVLTTTAQASNYGGASYSPSSTGTISRWNSSWRTTNDSYTFQLNPLWDPGHRAGVQNYVQNNNYRYTQEMNDTSLNLHATGWYRTTFPSPVYDSDDDQGHVGHEEAEVTATSTGFPTANYRYQVSMQFSRWYWGCTSMIGDCGYIKWDSGSGSVGHLSQMSEYSWGEWNAKQYTWPPYASYAYPSKSQTSSLTAGAVENKDEVSRSTAEGDSAGAVESAPISAEVIGTTIEVSGVTGSIEIEDGKAEARLRGPDGDWRAYVADVKMQSKSLLQERGPYRAVVTFVQPLSPRQFARLTEQSGVTVDAFEAVGLLPDGVTLTIGGPSESIDGLAAAYAEAGATMEGIVSADVLVDGATAYRALTKSQLVLVADLSAEIFARGVTSDGTVMARAPEGLEDVLLNDIFWEYSGRTR